MIAEVLLSLTNKTLELFHAYPVSWRTFLDKNYFDLNFPLSPFFFCTITQGQG